jgi:hypothetical protein
MPELVVHDKNSMIETVKFNDLPILLLNEFIKYDKIIKKQGGDIKMMYDIANKLSRKLMCK